MTKPTRTLVSYLATLALIGAAIWAWAESDHSVVLQGPQLPLHDRDHRQQEQQPHRHDGHDVGVGHGQAAVAASSASP